jgi:hypothetical protein
MNAARALLMLLLCLAAHAGDAWAVRQNGVIELPFRVGKDVGFALYPLDDDRLKLTDGSFILKLADKTWTARDEQIDYKTIAADAELTVDFVGQPELLALKQPDVDRSVAFAKANGVKAIIGYIYPEFMLVDSQPAKVATVDGKPVAGLGDVVVYVCETVARNPSFLVRRVHRVVLSAP